MEKEIQGGMHCAEFETLLFEAVDGTLVAGTMSRFQTHASTCATCGPLLAEAQAGQQWMHSLAEVEPPKNLVHNILAKTSGVAERYVESAAERLPSRSLGGLFGWVQPLLSGTWATVRQPRFGMSMAMAFFSVSLVMSVAGIKVNDIAKLDLRPSAVKRSYYSTQARVVKYYTNMRFVYEIESRLRDIKRATAPEGEPRQQQKAPRKEKDGSDKTSKRPDKGQGQNGERDRDQNYAQDDSQPMLAKAGDVDAASGARADAARRDV